MPKKDCRILCENCAHYKADTGECRRFPPVPFWTGEEVVSAFPLTDPDELCGEFAAKDN